MLKRIKAAAALLLCLCLCGCRAAYELPETTSEGDDTSVQSTASVSADEPDETDETYEVTSENNDGSSSLISGLSENATEREGRVGTGNFNYGEALQKSLIFYELQRSGELSGEERTNWRGDSGLQDGSDNGLDLTGGLYDAGDNVKFNLPMSYTSAMLAWSVYEDLDSYEESGQLEYILDTIRWVNDYLIKCHSAENEFYYQVGDGNIDHSWWGPSEVMQMSRPSYKVTESSPGSTVTAEAAASLAAAAAVFKDIDPSYAEECLTHAKQLFAFSEKTKSDSGYTAASGFYNSWSGFYDELSWAATWLYTASGDEQYLAKAKEYFASTSGNYKWTMCWDDVSLGAALRLAVITKENTYTSFVENNLDYWTVGVNGEKITYTPKGLAWLDSWGSLRYATTEAFIALSYSESELCPQAKQSVYHDFAVSQIDYALGSTGRSFVCGFGENYPENPHHRTAQGSYCDNMSIPETARHTLYGALVGGPDANDGYNDTVSDYVCNEVACDYNAGYTCALAKLYKEYGGQTLVNFGAVEEAGQEYELEACVNAAGDNFVEIKAIAYNETAWPARVSDNLTLRYFIDLSETDPSSVSVSINYAMGNPSAEIVAWDESKNIYCVQVSFGDDLIYPGGQDAYRREVQFRISSSGAWDNSNDFSYSGLGSSQGTAQSVSTIALYDGGTLVWGSEPDGSAALPASAASSQTTDTSTAQTTTAAAASQTTAAASAASITASSSGALSVTMDKQDGSNASTISLNLDITNNGSSAVKLSDIEVDYFFAAGNGNLVFTCDYSAVQGSDSYEQISNVSGSFAASNETGCDTVLKITCASGSIPAGGTWRIQARVNKDDWSAFGSNGSAKIEVYS